ncbi:hypothetical protein TNCV_633321 [Trichonephila clavipes]|nr:hypothetical protein TNCV_633321 [Trichonephila clavipes]
MSNFRSPYTNLNGSADGQRSDGSKWIVQEDRQIGLLGRRLATVNHDTFHLVAEQWRLLTGFVCKTIYRSSIANVFLGCPLPSFLTAVPMVFKDFQARKMTLLLHPNSSATLIKLHLSSSFPIILPRVKSFR